MINNKLKYYQKTPLNSEQPSRVNAIICDIVSHTWILELRAAVACMPHLSHLSRLVIPDWLLLHHHVTLSYFDPLISRLCLVLLDILDFYKGIWSTVHFVCYCPAPHKALCGSASICLTEINTTSRGIPATLGKMPIYVSSCHPGRFWALKFTPKCISETLLLLFLLSVCIICHPLETIPASHGAALARPSRFSCFSLKPLFQKMEAYLLLEVQCRVIKMTFWGE